MERYCEVKDCGRIHYGRGYCNPHYRKFRLYGDPMGRVRKPAPDCSVENCDETAYKRGYCNTHYIRQRRHGDVNATRRHTRPADGKCTVDGCERDWLSRDFCKLHYDRWARKRRECKLVGCYAKASERGLCDEHMQAAKLHTYEHIRGSAPEDGLCEVHGCTGKWQAMGYCLPHYQSNLAKPREAALLSSYMVECEACGESFNPSTFSPKFCSLECRPERFRRTASGRAYVLILADAHGWACGLCNLPIDEELAWPDVMSGSVDHIVPVTKGGDDEPGNLQLAHLGCNIRKGNRV